MRHRTETHGVGGGQGHNLGPVGSHSRWAVPTAVPLVNAVPYPQMRRGVGTASGWLPPLPRQPLS